MKRDARAVPASHNVRIALMLLSAQLDKGALCVDPRAVGSRRLGVPLRAAQVKERGGPSRSGL